MTNIYMYVKLKGEGLMKKNNENGGKHELISITSSVLMLVCICFFTGTEKLAAASAALMFSYPVTTETSVQATSKPEIKNDDVTLPGTTVSTLTTAATPSPKITDTPEDILKIIKKYTEIFADDKKDGDIKAVTYDKAGATHIFENVKVKNTTDTKTLNIEKVLSQPLELSVNKSKPAVLIFHSHTSEGYELIERSWYAQGYTARSNDENINIVRVGTEITDYLTKLGYTVIHDKTIHDNSYNDSYPSSRKTIEKHLEEHPEIQIVIDIHRDSITLDDGTKIKPLNTVNGQKAAQLMIITGAEEGKVEDFPDWEYNLRFALQLQKKCETLFPGLMRPVLFSQRKYNMDMTRFSLLIEMGSEANTLEEACYSGRMLAAALASLMDEYVEN